MRKENSPGDSDLAQVRFGEGIVPALAGPGHPYGGSGELCSGLPSECTASFEGENAIAKKTTRGGSIQTRSQSMERPKESTVDSLQDPYNTEEFPTPHSMKIRKEKVKRPGPLSRTRGRKDSSTQFASQTVTEMANNQPEEHAQSMKERVLPESEIMGKETGTTEQPSMENQRLITKRRATKTRDDDMGDSDGGASTVSASTSGMQSIPGTPEKHHPGRPPFTGEYLGMAAAKRQLLELSREELHLQAERELLDNWTEARKTRAMRLLIGGPAAVESTTPDERPVEQLTADELLAELETSTDAIRTIASFKKGYKGTSIKVLKEVATVVQATAQELSRRTQSEENRRLREENSRLKKEMTTLRTDIAELRNSMEDIKRRTAVSAILSPQLSPHGSPVSKKTRETREITASASRNFEDNAMDVEGGDGTRNLEQILMTRLTEIITARFDAIEERLLPERSFRPPLGQRTHQTEPTLDSRPRRKQPTFANVTRSNQNTLAEETAQHSTAQQRDSSRGRTLRPKKTDGLHQPSGNLPRYALEQYVSPPVQGEQDWEVVTPRGRKSAKGTDKQQTTTTVPRSASKGGSKGRKRTPSRNKQNGKKGLNLSGQSKPQRPQTHQRKIKPPKQAAILLTLAPALPNDENTMDTTDPEGNPSTRSLGEVVSKIRGKISLSDYGIKALTPKRAATGGILYEVPGPDSYEKADKLAEALRPMLTDQGVKVTRPVKMTELKISGLDDATDAKEITSAIARNGDCPEDKIRVGKISRPSNNRLGTVWAQCPTTAIKKIMDNGPLTIGWTKTKVEVLAARPLRCFKCLGTGHTRYQCREEIDRSHLCFKCGLNGHMARECTSSSPPNCPYCSSIGWEARHRYGSKSCYILRPPRQQQTESQHISQNPSQNRDRQQSTYNNSEPNVPTTLPNQIDTTYGPGGGNDQYNKNGPASLTGKH